MRLYAMESGFVREIVQPFSVDETGGRHSGMGQCRMRSDHRAFFGGMNRTADPLHDRGRVGEGEEKQGQKTKVVAEGEAGELSRHLPHLPAETAVHGAIEGKFLHLKGRHIRLHISEHRLLHRTHSAKRRGSGSGQSMDPDTATDTVSLYISYTAHRSITRNFL